MGLIVHRCSTCNATELHHAPFGREICDSGDLLPPELLPTWNNATNERIETVTQPGETFRGFGQFSVQLCGCEDCQRLYSQLQDAGGRR
ncbi:hypothetical protein M8C13_36195 [Crossiella sp. SN42]|uniref:hypothetical protein n=1 Tax=Crossiella sp. SN42 TaxID=2944808 RepID=UPI00207D402A|nr:hypothetical protein [Crossiella sp. SN42]MCO1581205.1 hypothetical protein [Crossiella sp. SN42]